MFDTCPPPDLRGGFNVDDTVRAPLRDANGAVVAELGHVSANLYLRRDALPYEGRLSLSYQGVSLANEASQRDVIVDVPLVTTTQILTARVGEALTSNGASKVRVSGAEGLNPPGCTASPSLSSRVEILEARGTLDPAKLVLDRDYARRIAVTFDWHDLGCGLSSVSGTVVLTFTTAHLGFNCNESIQLVGDAGPGLPFFDAAVADDRDG